jgi:bacteriocin biosynthesis cyclodehydratase domain-containing protein
LPNLKDQYYRLSPEWSIRQTERSLIISGGADTRYEIELDSSEESFFSSLKSSKKFTKKDLSPSDARAFESLITAKIIVPLLSKSKRFSISVIGDSSTLRLNNVGSMNDADLIVVVRTHSSFAELLQKINYTALDKPHLFVDIAYHHTVSVGPLVFHGETACIACLQGRISNRWGDETPPPSPKTASQYSDFASELIKTEITRIEQNDTSLTNKTISWNMQDRVIKHDQLLKVPLCPICNNKFDQNGALALPWDKDENTSHTV